MTGDTFRDAELLGWNRKAGFWDDTLGPVAHAAIAPLLDAVGATAGVHLLDVACGTGALVAAAALRGAQALGIDFAPAMLAEAARRHPGMDFQVADAEAIPLDDASVDAVTCSFGILHMERTERVFAEVARVLRPGIGRFAMTAWVPEGDFFALIGQAVQTHADASVPMPRAPPMFRFADERECQSALLAADFAEISFRRLPLVWTGSTPDTVLVLLHRGTVRAPMLIEAQAPEARAAIERAILRGAERYVDAGAIVLRWPALLTVARRCSSDMGCDSDPLLEM